VAACCEADEGGGDRVGDVGLKRGARRVASLALAGTAALPRPRILARILAVIGRRQRNRHTPAAARLRHYQQCDAMVGAA
jgi:hypothetical protein